MNPGNKNDCGVRNATNFGSDPPKLKLKASQIGKSNLASRHVCFWLLRRDPNLPLVIVIRLQKKVEIEKGPPLKKLFFGMKFKTKKILILIVGLDYYPECSMTPTSSVNPLEKNKMRVRICIFMLCIYGLRCLITKSICIWRDNISIIHKRFTI